MVEAGSLTSVQVAAMPPPGGESPVTPHDPLSLGLLLAAGDMDPRALAWMARGMNLFFKAGGRVPLERLLQLATTPARLRRAQRDVWLRTCAQEMEAENVTQLADLLADAYDTFLSRGPWRAWRDLIEPPEGSSRLRAALFHAARCYDGKPLSARQMYRILCHIPDEKWQRRVLIVEV